MSHKIVEMNDLLKSLEDAVKDPEHTLTKDTLNPLTNTKHREALTLFLTAAVLNQSYEYKKEVLHFDVCQNNEEGDSLDGYLNVKYPDGSDKELEFEQIMLTVEEIKGTDKETDISDLVIEKIKQKHRKRYDNPKGITLVVFLDIKGQTTLGKIKEYLKENNIFMFYIIVVLNQRYEGEGSYIYTVADLNPEREGNHSRFTVKIANDFSGYEVSLSEEI
jgi:hypothetical protein